MTISTFTHKAESMANVFYQQDFISTKNITLEQINLLLKTAAYFKAHPNGQQLSQRIIANCFFEPSTRTHLSFETALLRLNGKSIGFSSQENLSVKKGESFSDTIRVLANYADLLVVRHAAEGSARLAAEIADCPVINAGDGGNQHPTQAILDIFTIAECQKELHGLSIALVGDLKHARTIHSLLDVCSLFDMRIYLIAPEFLSLPDELCDRLKQKGLRFSFHHSLEEIIPKVDVIYMTRIQQERFASNNSSLMKSTYVLTLDMLRAAKPNLRILHPLPRVNELPRELDDSPYAYYFQQSANGVPVRQAILSLILNEPTP